MIKQCSACGAKYPANYNYCIKCEWDGPLEEINSVKPQNDIRIKDIKINPNEFYNFNSYKNQFDELDDLLSNDNISKLEEFNLKQYQFNEIIDNIKKTHEKILNDLINEYEIDFENLPIIDKMLLFSKSFVKTEYKEGGGDLGHFEFNEIYIDDRLENALQITTIIHELSHFLLSEILEQIVSTILNTSKTDVVEAFVCYNLVKDDFNYLVDEYCAHTVEGRFAVLGYQDYGSYKEVLKRFLVEYTEEHIDVANTIGNTFACYIKSIFASFIDENLREEIKEEYLKLKDEKRYAELQFETSDYLMWDNFKEAIRLILTRNIDEYITNSEDIRGLHAYSIRFKKNNGG